MDTIYRIASRLARITRHRGFAASVLAVGSAGVVALASVTANAVIGAPTDMVVLKMKNSPYVVQAAWPTQAWEVREGFDVQVTADGTLTLMRVASGTVASALETVGVTVSDEDIVSVPLTEELAPDMEITVQRVTYRDYTQTEKIPFETKVRYDSKLAKGVTKTEVDGVDGEQVVTIRERLVDGEVVESNRADVTVTKKPVTKQVVKGSYVAPTVTTSAAKPVPGSNAAYNYTTDDVYYLAVAIYREAGSDYLSDEQRALVGCVVMNRVRSKAFPNTVYGVLTQPGQYQGLSNGVYLPSGVSTSSRAFKRAERIAKEVLEGQWSCPSNVVFQANFPQGSGTYKVMTGGGTVTYFCYR